MALNRAKTRSLVEKHMRAGRLDAAVKELQKLADDNPHDVQVINQIGNLQLRLGNKEVAVRLFLKVADLYHKNGFATKAVASLKIATREDPENMEAWQMLADLSEKQGFSLEARAAFDRVAKLLEKSGDLQKLIKVQKKLLALDPNNIKARVQMGDNLIQLKRVKEGIKQYIDAAKQLLLQGHTKEAALLIDRALELDPETLRFLEKFITELLEKKQAGLVVGILDILIEKHPETESLLLLKIECLMQEKRSEEAVSACRELLKVRPGSAQAAVRLVRLLMAEKKYDDISDFLGSWINKCDESKLPEAEALFQEVLRFNPEHLGTLSGLAALYRKSGNDAGLTATLESKLRVAHETGRSDEEASVLGELLELQPDNAEYKGRLKKLQGVPEKEEPAPEEEVSEVEGTGELEIEIEASDLELSTPDVTASLSNQPPGLTVDAGGEEEESGEVEEVEEIEEVSFVPDAPPAGGSAKKKPTLDASEAQTIREQLTEAEVFLKYGFADKAIRELQAVLQMVPDHVHAHQKLIAIYKQQNKKGKIVTQLLKLARVFKENDDDETCQSLLDEARKIDPNNRAIAKFMEEAPPSELEARMHEVKKTLEQGAQKGTPELDLGLLIPVSEGVRSAPTEEEIEVDIDLEEEKQETEEGAGKLAEIEEAEAVSGSEEYEEPEAEPEPEPEAEPVGEEAVAEQEESSVEVSGEVGSLELGLSEEEPAPDELQEKLEEAEFYLSQELFGEAGRVLTEIEERWSDDDRVKAFKLKLEKASGMEPEPPGRVEVVEEEAEEEVETSLETETLEKAEGVEVSVEESGSALFSPEGESETAVEDASATAENETSGESTVSEEEASVEDEVEEALEEESGEVRRSRTKMKVSLSELLPEGVIEKDEEVLREGSSEESNEFYDLASELGAALDGLQGPEEELFEDEKSPEEMSFEEVFEEFKKGVEKKIGEEDYSTHYNLGIAYKEMELLDEAIGEFQIAARSPQYTIECCSMLGLCFRQKEMPELAEKWYRKGIEAPGFSEDAYIGLKYDLAETLEEEGNKDEAMVLYREVYAVNANHRDVATKVKEAKKEEKS